VVTNVPTETGGSFCRGQPRRRLCHLHLRARIDL